MLTSNELRTLPSQFQLQDNGSNANLNKLLTAFLLPFQQFSDNIFNTANGLLDINNSIGSQLDVIGKLISSLRNSLSDDDYRVLIKLKTKLNNADGTANFTMFAIDKALGANQNFYLEGTPAKVILYLNLKSSLTDYQLNILKNTIVCGVGLQIYYTLNNQIYVLSETFVPFLIEDGSEEFLIGGDQNQDKFMVSDITGNGGNLESATFARALSIKDGSEEFLIGNGDEPFLVTNFDKV